MDALADAAEAADRSAVDVGINNDAAGDEGLANADWDPRPGDLPSDDEDGP